MSPTQQLLEQALADFVLNFVEHPYDAYTEHGQHALFYADLLHRIPPNERYASWQGRRVCVLQKEYPTAHHLDKPQRQHWDIALLKNPCESAKAAYDYMRLSAVAEFGMNANEAHLREDVRRLTHAESNVERGYIVHLYRLSTPGRTFSGRDWSTKSRRILTPEQVAQYTEDNGITAYYSLHDDTGLNRERVCRIEGGEVVALRPE